MRVGDVRTKRHRGVPSRTPGKLKGESCQASPLDRTYAKRSRSYKMRGYLTWCRKTEIINHGKNHKGGSHYAN